jgi:hypothetical protein
MLKGNKMKMKNRSVISKIKMSVKRELLKGYKMKMKNRSVISKIKMKQKCYKMKMKRKIDTRVEDGRGTDAPVESDFRGDYVNEQSIR